VELAALVGAFIGEPELLDHLLGRILYEVEFRAGLIRVRRWKRIEKPMQPEHGCIGDQHLSKQFELWSDRVRNRDLLESVLEEVAQQCGECRREPIIEAGAGNGLVGCCGVCPLKSGDGAGFAVEWLALCLSFQST